MFVKTKSLAPFRYQAQFHSNYRLFYIKKIFNNKPNISNQIPLNKRKNIFRALHKDLALVKVKNPMN